jgi:septum formation protein
MTYSHLMALAATRRLVLGSASPRRVHLLRETGVPFRQAVADVDESRRPNENPFACALRLAEEKALTVARQADMDEIVIGGDTVVILNDIILGKPVDESDAARMLAMLAGKQHTVCTALALAHREGLYCSGEERTDVYFNAASQEQISRYIASGEPRDKAGAYGIQGMGAFLVDRIEGNLDTVIGLPRLLLDRLAKDTLHKLK